MSLVCSAASYCVRKGECRHRYQHALAPHAEDCTQETTCYPESEDKPVKVQCVGWRRP